MGKPVVRLGWRIRKNGHGAGSVWKERRDEKKYMYSLTTGNLTKRAKGIYKKVSTVQNLIFK
jgi:hypothetical protein